MRTVLCAVLFVIVGNVHAEEISKTDTGLVEIPADAIYATEQRVFNNVLPLCTSNDTCDLERVIFRTKKFEYNLDESGSRLTGTKMFMGLVTKDVFSLTKYYFVQFTRGCMWDSYQNADGTILTEFGVVRDFQGIKRIQHVLPIWTVDSNDQDPAYGSSAQSDNRQFFLQSDDSVPFDIPASQGKLIGEIAPTIPFAYIIDMPGPAKYNSSLSWARNMSLEYKTCVFKAGDVPVSGLDFTPEKAITCVNWEAKFVFDHKTKLFREGGEINGECRRPFTASERKFHMLQLEPKNKEE